MIESELKVQSEEGSFGHYSRLRRSNNRRFTKFSTVLVTHGRDAEFSHWFYQDSMYLVAGKRALRSKRVYARRKLFLCKKGKIDELQKKFVFSFNSKRDREIIIFHNMNVTFTFGGCSLTIILCFFFFLFSQQKKTCQCGDLKISLSPSAIFQ